MFQEDITDSVLGYIPESPPQNSMLDYKVVWLVLQASQKQNSKDLESREQHFGPCWIILGILFNL